MAWQDMNRMPTNIMPAVIEETEEEDEHEVTQEDIEDDIIVSTVAFYFIVGSLEES